MIIQLILMGYFFMICRIHLCLAAQYALDIGSKRSTTIYIGELKVKHCAMLVLAKADCVRFCGL